MKRRRLSLAQARRIALAAQGFDRPRPGRATARDLRRVIRQLGLVQFDSVNVFDRAHYTVPFSRVGPYDRDRLHRLLYRDGEFTEQWAHEASILPVEAWPLFKPRMAASSRRTRFLKAFLAKYPSHPNYLEDVLDDVRANGPLRADEVSEHLVLPKPTGNWGWNWTPARGALEVHFAQGTVAVTHRDGDLARSYDLAERVLPAEHHQRDVAHEEAIRELVLRSARAHGVGTANDLGDYYRLSMRDVRPALVELVDDGALQQVEVDGLDRPAYLHPEARLPRKIEASALLSPFDPVVWHRSRGEWLFDFDYRIEIYVPKPQRKYGYYVVPYLLGDRIVARVDLKSDRQSSRLLVQSAHLEEHAEASDVAGPLAEELATVGEWLGLDTVQVEPSGSLAPALRDAVG